MVLVMDRMLGDLEDVGDAAHDVCLFVDFPVLGLFSRSVCRFCAAPASRWLSAAGGGWEQGLRTAPAGPAHEN